MTTALSVPEEHVVESVTRSAPLELPGAVVAQAKRCILDLIGVAAGGFGTPQATIVRDHVLAEAGERSIGPRVLFRRASRAGDRCGLANSTMIESLDAHDGHSMTKGHAGVAVLPAVIAALEESGSRLSGPELLTLVVQGYELAIRAGLALHGTAPDYHKLRVVERGGLRGRGRTSVRMQRRGAPRSRRNRRVLGSPWTDDALHHESLDGEGLVRLGLQGRSRGGLLGEAGLHGAQPAVEAVVRLVRERSVSPFEVTGIEVGYDSALPQRHQDIAQAKSLLKAAGQEGLSIQLVTADVASGTTQAAQIFAQQASAAGVTVNLQELTVTDFYGKNYLQWGFAQDYWSYAPCLVQVGNATLPSSPYNECHFDDPHYTSLYEEAIRTVDETRRTQIIHEMQQIDYSTGGYIIPYFVPIIDGYSSHVHGLVPSKVGIPLSNFGFGQIWMT